MSHAALIQIWRDWGTWPESRQGAPPPLDHLLEMVSDQVADARACAAHLEPSSLTGYGMYINDNWTIGDAIRVQQWRETRWALALAAPDHRPPLFACLLELAEGPRLGFDGRLTSPRVDNDELWWARRCWDGHESPIGRLVDRLWRAKRSGKYEGSQSTMYHVDRDQEAVDYWLAEALDAEREHARYLLERL